MSEKIYVLIDHSNDQIPSSSWESLAFGQKMAETTGHSLHALVLGKEALAEQVAGAKGDSVLLVKNDNLTAYDPDTHCSALCQILNEDLPAILLMGHTYQNIDLAPKLAARLERGLVTDCIGYRKEGDHWIFVRQMFRNKINVDTRIESPHPWIVTLQSGAVNAEELSKGTMPVMERQVDLSSVTPRRTVIETIPAARGKVDLTKADIIVSVGRGIKKQENLKIIEDLAAALDAAIGASRPVIDNQWLGRDRQIGSSGQTVAPMLYVACGISGAIQHIVGMKNSRCIVAINKDPNAPIFNVATYGAVGDLFEIVPALTRKLKEEQG